jgi:stage V sporulation protein G
MHETDYPTMPVTAVKVTLIPEPMGKTKALATITLADQFQVRGLRIVDGTTGKFVAYPNDPSYKAADYQSLCYPTTRNLRDTIENAVLAEYNRIAPKENV